MPRPLGDYASTARTRRPAGWRIDHQLLPGSTQPVLVLAALSSVRKRVVANMIPRSAAYARSSARGPAEPRLPGP
jgi:hypothetical protein